MRPRSLDWTGPLIGTLADSRADFLASCRPLEHATQVIKNEGTSTHHSSRSRPSHRQMLRASSIISSCPLILPLAQIVADYSALSRSDALIFMLTPGPLAIPYMNEYPESTPQWNITCTLSLDTGNIVLAGQAIREHFFCAKNLIDRLDNGRGNGLDAVSLIYKQLASAIRKYQETEQR